VNISHGYHGTTADIPIGGRVLPAAKHRQGANHGLSNPKKTYFTAVNQDDLNLTDPDPDWRDDPAQSDRDAENEAWKWGESGRFARAAVYKTKPLGAVKYDDNAGHAYTTSSQRVLDRVDTPPPAWGEVGVQGTFPPVNWNQFDAKGRTIMDPAGNYRRLPDPTYSDEGPRWRGMREVPRFSNGTVVPDREEEAPRRPAPQLPGQGQLFDSRGVR
jgi:hypothetical protein